MSIRLRLTLWYSAVLGVTVISCCVAVYLLVAYVLSAGEKSSMQALAKQIEREIGVRIGWNFFLGPSIVPELPALDEFRYSGYFLQIVDRDGHIRQKKHSRGAAAPCRCARRRSARRSVVRGAEGWRVHAARV